MPFLWIPMPSLCCRRPPDWSGMISPRWSHTGYLGSAPHLACALTYLPGESAPWSSQAQIWGSLACSSNLFLSPFLKNRNDVPLFQVTEYVAWQKKKQSLFRVLTVFFKYLKRIQMPSSFEKTRLSSKILCPALKLHWTWSRKSRKLSRSLVK